MQRFAKFKKILRRVFRATLYFGKFKVALNPLRRIFLNFAKRYILSCWLQFDNKKMGVTEFVFELKALKAKIKGIFSRSYCCYGNPLYHKINSNLFPDDWAVCWYHDCGINR